MRVDVIASEAHYLSHLLPIWAALPPHLQGTVHQLAEPGQVVRPAFGRTALVAGWQDVAPLRDLTRMIYVEHGSGQTYAGREHDPSYSGSGGARHRGVIGYICPSQMVADRFSKPATAVGCPKLDRFIGIPKPVGSTPTACFVWHWDCKMVQEASSVWPHYEPFFSAIVGSFREQGFRVVAHEHPKWRGQMAERMTRYGVDVLARDADVFIEADLMIVDNSSLAFEFMALGRPVVFMNAPWYRFEVNHGGRFWDWVIDHPMVDDPLELSGLDLWEVVIPDTEAINRTADLVYAYRDGSSSRRAARAVQDLIGE